MQTVQIIVIGDEILEGLTLDTNSHWLCEFLSGIGGRVERVVKVRDDLEAIASELKHCLSGGGKLIFTTGGLGPTGDDVTMEAVSAGLGLPLEHHDKAADMISKAYRKLFQQGLAETPEIEAARKKMSLLPTNSRPLSNPLGTAPGVLIEVASQPAEAPDAAALTGSNPVIICLPGVPSEMKAVVATALAEDLAARFGNAAYLREDYYSDCRDEAMLAGPLAEIKAEFPKVKISSHAERMGTEFRIRITACCAAATWEEARELLAKATSRVNAKLATNRIMLHSMADHKEAEAAILSNAEASQWQPGSQA